MPNASGLFLLMIGIGTFVLIYGMRIKARRNERLADLYQKALDNGVNPRDIKIDLDEKELGDPAGNLKAGIILLATALSIALGFLAAERLPGIWKLFGFAFVPGGIGRQTCAWLPLPGPTGLFFSLLAGYRIGAGQ